MSHLITCPECSKPLQVPENLLGKKVQCPECTQTFIAMLPEEPSFDARSTSKPPPRDKTRTDNGVTKTTNRARVEDEDKDERDAPRRRSRYDAQDDEDDDLSIRRRPSTRHIKRDELVPGKVTGIGIMALIGGIFAILLFLGWSAGSSGFCCLWPGTYYSLVVGILAIVHGSAFLGSNAYLRPPPTFIGVMMIINIINGDFINLVLGIIILVFCSDEEVTAYLAR